MAVNEPNNKSISASHSSLAFVPVCAPDRNPKGKKTLPNCFWISTTHWGPYGRNSFFIFFKALKTVKWT